MQKKRVKTDLFCNFISENRKGQVTIFIIIAMIIVVGVAIFFVFRQDIQMQGIPASIQPVYSSFLSCIEDKTRTGIDVLESQGGYIELPNTEPGSNYMPFSSQLNFFGNSIPYWYYVSGNNIAKEQMPSEKDMEISLGNFLNERIRDCNFNSFYEQGFEIIQDEPKTTVNINGDNVDVKINMDMSVNFGNDSALIDNHEISIDSKLGTLYNSAKTVYNKEQKELFLENYGVDTMRLYAPVDGVELSCSPQIWNADDVFTDLQEAIEINTLAIKTQAPSDNGEKYFYVSGINGNTRFINSKDWPSSFEVLPSQENILIANPVGNQQGLGILGFCYAPYHFVYNINYPVLIQISEGEETFQFPVAVVIRGNKPRNALNTTSKAETSELCSYKNIPVTVSTYNSNGNLIEASVSYKCFGESCNIGKTSSGIINADFPQCINGYIIARAEGYKESKILYSTNQGGSASIILDKLYDLNVNLKLAGNNYNGKAMIYFTGDNSQIISYPEQKSIKLSEGTYNVSVYVYKDSSIQLNGGTTQQCVDVLSSGIGGIFGMTEKKCVDVNLPSQVVSNVLAGGGTQIYSVSEGSLSSSDSIEINAEEMKVPTSMEELQNNYLAFETKKLEINLK